MSCRDIQDILSRLGSAGLDSAALAHCDQCSACGPLLASEQALDDLLGAAMPPMASSPGALDRILKAVACEVPEETVLSFLDDSLRGAELKSYEQHRRRCERCQSLEAQHIEVWQLLDQGFPAPLPYDPEAVARCQQAILGQNSLTLNQRPQAQRQGSWAVYFKAAAAVLIAGGLAALLLSTPKNQQIANNERPKTIKRTNKPDEAPQRIEVKDPKPEQPEKPAPLPEKPEPRPEQRPDRKPEPIKEVKPEAQPELPPIVRKDPVRSPVRSDPPPSEREVLLASLSPEDREIVQNLELLEELEAAENIDVVLNADILTAIDSEDLE